MWILGCIIGGRRKFRGGTTDAGVGVAYYPTQIPSYRRAKFLGGKEISYQLGIKPGTVKEHISRLLRKLNLRNRTEAAVYAAHFDLSPQS